MRNLESPDKTEYSGVTVLRMSKLGLSPQWFKDRFRTLRATKG